MAAAITAHEAWEFDAAGFLVLRSVLAPAEAAALSDLATFDAAAVQLQGSYPTVT
jgi:hypothetical protein